MLPVSYSSLVQIFTVLVVIFGLTQCEASQEVPRFQRVARNFPYSLAYSKMMRPAYASIQPMASFTWPPRIQSNEIRDFIDLLDEEGQRQQLHGRERRSAGPVFKRYACRFKFCRIFDA